MGKITGFLEYPRELPRRRPAAERVNDWREIYLDFPEESIREQGARCMDCGVPFCHTGCPLANIIPDWNLSLIHISEPTRLGMISYAVFCLKKKKEKNTKQHNKPIILNKKKQIQTV